MATGARVPQRIRIRKALMFYGGEYLPAGSEITLTEEWDTIPPDHRGRVILDPLGQRRLVEEDDLEYALGAH